MRYRLWCRKLLVNCSYKQGGVYFEPDEKFTEQGNCFATGYFCKDCGISYHPVVETVAGAAERLSVSLEFFVKKAIPQLFRYGLLFYFIYRD